MDDIAYLSGGILRTRLPPTARLMRVALGLAAAVSLSGAAIAVLLNHPSAATLSFAGHAALVAYAVMSTQRAYARFWLPSLALLALVGASGAAADALPASTANVSWTSLTHFGLDGLRYGAQLGAMAMTAMAWSTAGRNHAYAQSSLFALSVTATSQLLTGVALVSTAPVGALFNGLTELCFALWFLATLGRTWGSRGARRRVVTTFNNERLPPEPWDALRLASQHGDVLR